MTTHEPNIASLPPAGRALSFGRGPVAAVLVVVAAVVTAQEPEPRFSAATDLVQVDVSVLDSRRRPVRGLTAADFVILEDGQPRPVEAFTEVDLRAAGLSGGSSWSRTVPPDVAGNQAADSDGRVVIILMDRSIPAGQPTVAAREIAVSAIDSLGPGDLGAVLSTGVGLPRQNLTANKTLLRRLVDDPSVDWSQGATAESAAIEFDREKIQREMVRDMGIDPDTVKAPFSDLTDGRCLCGACVPETIAMVADALDVLPRHRKLVLFVGSAVRWQTDDDRGGCSVMLRSARNRMMAALERSSVTIHSIDPTGLEVVADALVGTVRPTSARLSPAQREAILGVATQTAGREHQVARDSLGVLPDYTGGRFVRNTNAPHEHVPAIFEETSSYYLLGFAPADLDISRPLRSIEVKVNRPGVRVQARRQYLLPTATVTAEAGAPAAGTDRAATAAAAPSTLPLALDDALTGLLPVSHVPMSLHAAAFAKPGAPGAVVTVSATVDGLAPDSEAAGIAPLEIVAGAYDQTGRPVTSARQTLELSWPPASARERRRVEALSRLELPPGDYEVRVAAAGAHGTRTASVFTHVTVPDYARAPLSLSHIVFGADHAATSSAPPGLLDDVLPVAPTTARVFGRSSAVTAFMQVYQGTMRTDPLQSVAVRVRILDQRDDILRDQGLVLVPDSFGKHRTSDVRFTLPVQNLPAGDYLLALETQMGERQAGRAVRFNVR